MANENENQGHEEGRDSEFETNKKAEFGKSTQDTSGQQSQQPQTGQQGQQGQTGVADRSGQQGSTGGAEGSGFVGSQGEESGEYLQEGQTKQAGFAEQGRGAPEDGGDIERDGERTANRDSDIEGSSGQDR